MLLRKNQSCLSQFNHLLVTIIPVKLVFLNLEKSEKFCEKAQENAKKFVKSVKKCVKNVKNSLKSVKNSEKVLNSMK